MTDFSAFAVRACLKQLSGEVPDQFDGVYIGDLLSRAMSHVETGCLWITIMNNANVIAVAKLTDPSAVILAEGVTLIPEALAQAQANDIAVFTAECTAYELAKYAAEAEG